MRHLVAILLVVLAFQTRGQEANLQAEQDSVALGAPLRLTVSLCHDISDSLTVKWPTWAEELSPEVEILLADTSRTFLPNPIDQPNWLCEEQVLVIALWDTGFVAIPPILLETTVGTFRTQPLLLHSSGPAVDHTNTYKPNLPALPIGYAAGDWLSDWWWALALLLLALGGIWWWARRNNAVVLSPELEAEAELIMPHVTAFERLEALQGARQWQQGNVKAYHSELNDIFRQYLEGRYGIPAREETTDEIIASLNHRGMQPGITERITGVLHMADLVKFAKANPGALDNENAWQEVFDFVDKTRLNTAAS